MAAPRQPPRHKEKKKPLPLATAVHGRSAGDRTGGLVLKKNKTLPLHTQAHWEYESESESQCGNEKEPLKERHSKYCLFHKYILRIVRIKLLEFTASDSRLNAIILQEVFYRRCSFKEVLQVTCTDLMHVTILYVCHIKPIPFCSRKIL